MRYHLEWGLIGKVFGVSLRKKIFQICYRGTMKRQMPNYIEISTKKVLSTFRTFSIFFWKPVLLPFQEVLVHRNQIANIHRSNEFFRESLLWVLTIWTTITTPLMDPAKIYKNHFRSFWSPISRKPAYKRNPWRWVFWVVRFKWIYCIEKVFRGVVDSDFQFRSNFDDRFSELCPIF